MKHNNKEELSHHHQFYYKIHTYDEVSVRARIAYQNKIDNDCVCNVRLCGGIVLSQSLCVSLEIAGTQSIGVHTVYAYMNVCTYVRIQQRQILLFLYDDDDSVEW